MQTVDNKTTRNHTNNTSRCATLVSKRVQQLNFDPDNPFANLDDTQYYDEMGIYTTWYQEAVINNLVNGKPNFDISQPCKVCLKTGHTFDNCPVLNNTPFLRKQALANTYATNRVTKEVIEFANGEDNVEDHIELQDFPSEDR